MPATLFGDAEEIAKPRTPPPEYVVNKLLALGVPETKVRGYESRQAFAVLAKLERELSEVTREEVEQPPAAPVDRGATYPERLQAADDLANLLANEMGDPWERICQRFVCTLYTLTRAEFRRVLEATMKELRSEVR
jgi:hypothetical protein